jgi:hypothetical protein
VKDWLVSREPQAERFDLEDFIRRVSERAESTLKAGRGYAAASDRRTVAVALKS